MRFRELLRAARALPGAVSPGRRHRTASAAAADELPRDEPSRLRYRSRPKHVRISWLLVSVVVHGAAVAAVIGFGASGVRLDRVPAYVEWQQQVASAPSVPQVSPLPEVTAEDLVEELAVCELQVHEPEEVEVAKVEPVTEASALAAVQVAPSPSEILQQVSTVRIRKKALQPVEEAAEQPVAQPQVVAPPQAYVEAQRSDNRPPEYPAKERRLGREGKVLVRVLVDAVGHVERVDLVTPSKYAGFNQAALAAARQWTFMPATRDGVAVASETDIEIEFCMTGH